jgi:hypothetical protein
LRQQAREVFCFCSIFLCRQKLANPERLRSRSFPQKTLGLGAGRLLTEAWSLTSSPKLRRLRVEAFDFLASLRLSGACLSLLGRLRAWLRRKALLG